MGLIETICGRAIDPDPERLADTLHGLLLLTEAHTPIAVLAELCSMSKWRLDDALEAARRGEVRPIIRELIVEPEPMAPLAAHWRADPQVMRQTAQRYGVRVTDITGPSRKPKFVEAAWRLRHELNRSIEEVARQIGRHHATALYAIRQHELRLAREGRAAQ